MSTPMADADNQSEKLRECPFCGGTELSRLPSAHSGKLPVELLEVQCEGCGAIAQDEKSWNTRPSPIGGEAVAYWLRSLKGTTYTFQLTKGMAEHYQRSYSSYEGGCEIIPLFEHSPVASAQPDGMREALITSREIVDILAKSEGLGWKERAGTALAQINAVLSAIPAPQEGLRELIERTSQTLNQYDLAMASQPKGVSNATLIVMANYGDFAISHCREFIRALSPAPTSEGKVDLLTEFAKHPNWDLQLDPEDSQWIVYAIHGSINDREWHEIGRGNTPASAITKALAHKGKDNG